MCPFVSERVSENSCDCEKGNEVRHRCAFVGDDRTRERLDGGLLISQASVCVSIYSQTSSFQAQSDCICFCIESRGDRVGSRVLKLLRCLALRRRGTELMSITTLNYTFSDAGNLTNSTY